MGDIQNGQEPKHEADTDLEKDIVSPTHFNQQLGLSLFGVGEAGRVVMPVGLTHTKQRKAFIPKNSQSLASGTITMLIWLTIVCLAMQLIDGRRCVISFHWRRPFRNVKTIIGNCTRIIAAALSIFLLWSFTWNLGVNGSWSYNWAKSLGDNSTLWSTATDATNNGPTMTFYDWRT